MTFFIIEPETSGSYSARSASGVVTCSFDYWLGDDPVRAYPAVLVTGPVKTALRGLGQASGFKIAKATVKTSTFYRKHNPGGSLPLFWAVDVHGEPGRDDMGVTAAGQLVVSRRVLDLLLHFRIGRAVLAQYAGEDRAAQQGDAAVEARCRRRPRHAQRH
jgi:hypothetical protein